MNDAMTIAEAIVIVTTGRAGDLQSAVAMKASVTGTTATMDKWKMCAPAPSSACLGMKKPLITAASEVSASATRAMPRITFGRAATLLCLTKLAPYYFVPQSDLRGKGRFDVDKPTT